MSIDDINLNAEFRSLQQHLGLIDMLMEPRRPSKRRSMELLLLKVQKIKYKIYQEKTHPLPHIHIDYGKVNHAASYAIATGERLEGNIPKNYDETISNWVIRNKDKLLQIWIEVQNGNSEKYENLIKELPGN